MASRTEECFCWDAADFCWDSNEYCWGSVCREIVSRGKAPDQWYEAFNELEKEKREIFIELVCTVKEQQGDSTYREQKRLNEDIKLTVEDVEVAIKHVLGPQITLQIL